MSPTNAKTKTTIYTGAPISSSLSWSESNLTAPLQPAYFPPKPPTLPSLSASPPTTTKEDHNTTTTAPYPTWRSLPLHRAHLPTGLTQATTNPEVEYYRPEGNGEEMSSFLSTTDLSFVSDSVNGAASTAEGTTHGTPEEDILTQYYEHSFAVHEDALPTEDSFLSSPYSSSFPSTPTTNTNETLTTTHPTTLLLPSPPLTNLAAIPSASYLHSIEPQTMTVNLLLGIIALPPPRTIITRKAARALALHELTVGDDTKAGFGINIWLPPAPNFADGIQKKKNGDGEADLRVLMEELRARDVVLVRNVALAAFRGRVYGQSLRRGVTRVELVWRGGDGGRRGWEGVEKARRVREWVLGFVGDGGRGKGGDGGMQLPADTQ